MVVVVDLSDLVDAPAARPATAEGHLCSRLSGHWSTECQVDVASECLWVGVSSCRLAEGGIGITTMTDGA